MQATLFDTEPRVGQPHPAKFDLHCHSNASDGALAPSDVVRRAASRGVAALALTDHDTLAGLDEAKAVAVEVGVKLIPGVEISCQWQQHTLHVVALGFDSDCSSFLRAIEAQAQARNRRAGLIDEALQRKGCPSVLAEARSMTRDGIPGRPHFARALVGAGCVRTEQQAFKRWLGAGKVGDILACWPDLAEVVRYIHASGGVAVLAHPRKYRMSATRLRKLVEEFASVGGDALEVLTGGQAPSDTELLSDLCIKHGLRASCGSDFHKPGQPWTELGSLPPLPHHLTPIWANRF